MKKTLLTLGNFSLISSITFMVISCNDKIKSKKNELKIWDLGLLNLDKITSVEQLNFEVTQLYKSKIHPSLWSQNWGTIFKQKINTSIKQVNDFLKKLNSGYFKIKISFSKQISQFLDQDQAFINITSHFFDFFKLALKEKQEWPKLKTEKIKQINSLLEEHANKLFTNKVFREWATSNKITLEKYVEFQLQEIPRFINLVERYALILKTLANSRNPTFKTLSIKD